MPPPGSPDADLARQKTALFLAAIRGERLVDADPRMTGGMPGKLPVQPQSPGLAERIWWAAGTRATAEWAARQVLNLMSSTLLAKDAAVREADTLLLTVPNMLGVDHNARLLETVARSVAPAIGWVPPAQR